MRAGQNLHRRQPDRIDTIVSRWVVAFVSALALVVFAVNGWHLMKEQPWASKDPPYIGKVGKMQ